MSGVEKALGCVCLLYKTKDGVHRTLNISKGLTPSELDILKWLGLILFSSILQTVQV